MINKRDKYLQQFQISFKRCDDRSRAKKLNQYTWSAGARALPQKMQKALIVVRLILQDILVLQNLGEGGKKRAL